MRKYTVIESDFGSMPSAGYGQTIIKMISDFDAWYAIEFLKEFADLTSKIEENGEGELFIIIDGDSEVCSDFKSWFIETEEIFSHTINNEEIPFVYNPIIYRMFCINEDWGLERIEILT